MQRLIIISPIIVILLGCDQVPNCPNVNCSDVRCSSVMSCCNRDLPDTTPTPNTTPEVETTTRTAVVIVQSRQVTLDRIEIPQPEFNIEPPKSPKPIK